MFEATWESVRKAVVDDLLTPIIRRSECQESQDSQRMIESGSGKQMQEPCSRPSS